MCFSSFNHHPIYTEAKTIIKANYCLHLWRDELRGRQAGCLTEGLRAVRKSQLLTTGYLWWTSYGTCLLPLTSSCSWPEILYLRRHSIQKNIWQHETLLTFLCMINKSARMWYEPDTYMTTHRLKWKGSSQVQFLLAHPLLWNWCKVP